MNKQSWYQKEIYLSTVSQTDVVTMAQNMAVMLKAGLTVSEAIETLIDQSTGNFKRILKQVLGRIESGELLGDALEKHENVFGPIFVSSVRIGESSGTLAENLQILSEQLERELEIRRSVHGAMLYPGIILTSALILGLALATFVLPQLSGIFDSLHVTLPRSTRAVMWLANLFRLYGTVLTPSIVLTVLALVVLFKQRFMHPVTHRLLLMIPGVKGFVHDINRARFARMIGTMLHTGVPIQEALQIATHVLPNYVYAQSVKVMHERIETGESFSEIVALYPVLYPTMVQRMIAVGERSGGMDETLTYLARFYEQKVAIKARSLATIIEPVLLILIGLVVGFLALAIFTPIYSVTEGLRF